MTRWATLFFAVALQGCISTGSIRCKDLASIREVPFKDEEVADATYNRVFAIASRAPEQLLACLDDPTRMPDPRKAPPYPGFAIGDLALFILSDTTGVPIETTLPPPVRAKWARDGVFAYFEFVSVAANRQALRSEWEKRLTETQED
jgi:hypothetical protein